MLFHTWMRSLSLGSERMLFEETQFCSQIKESSSLCNELPQKQLFDVCKEQQTTS